MYTPSIQLNVWHKQTYMIYLINSFCRLSVPVFKIHKQKEDIHFRVTHTQCTHLHSNSLLRTVPMQKCGIGKYHGVDIASNLSAGIKFEITVDKNPVTGLHVLAWGKSHQQVRKSLHTQQSSQWSKNTTVYSKTLQCYRYLPYSKCKLHVLCRYHHVIVNQKDSYGQTHTQTDTYTHKQESLLF